MFRALRALRYLLPAAAWLLVADPAAAEQATVAVAANFGDAIEKLRQRFEATEPHELVLVRGSTGQLYAQIVNGAPFDVLLAADTDRPRRLIEAGHAVADSRFTYARGRLVLWSARPEIFDEFTLQILAGRQFRRLAVANPALAPYGAAARQALQNLGYWQDLEGRIAYGQNVAQAFAMAATGGAELGLVALSQAVAFEGRAAYLPIDPSLHDPIQQDAVLLVHGANNAAAIALLGFLRSAHAGRLIRESGYLQ